MDNMFPLDEGGMASPNNIIKVQRLNSEFSESYGYPPEYSLLRVATIASKDVMTLQKLYPGGRTEDGPVMEDGAAQESGVGAVPTGERARDVARDEYQTAQDQGVASGATLQKSFLAASTGDVPVMEDGTALQESGVDSVPQGERAPDVARDEDQTAHATNMRFLDLSFLEQLAFTDGDFTTDPFFPSGEIYIRDCMRLIFGLFSKRDNAHTVLLGSPGVGKSVLCFLAAMHKTQKKPVVFYRQTSSHKFISVFIMRRKQGGAIDVVFTRLLHKNSVKVRGGLCVLHDFLVKKLVGLHRYDEVLWFVDGPKHDDQQMMTDFSFFCTSGGYPMFADEDSTGQCWVLDGWTRGEAMVALSRRDFEEGTIDMAYYLCGGNIRNMLAACSDYDAVQNKVQRWVDELDVKSIEDFAFTSTERGANKKYDRLLTMFRKVDPHVPVSLKLMRADQYVDSAFAMNRFAEDASIDVLAKGYRYSIGVSNRSLQGLYYEMVIHQWFTKEAIRCLDGIGQVCWSKGNGAQGVTELNQVGIYWIPSIPNFANIDAAVVLGNTLHALQYTVKDTHDFKNDSFEKFLTGVWMNIQGIHRAQVHFVSPSTNWIGPGKEGTPSTIFTYERTDYTVSYQCHTLDLMIDTSKSCHELFSRILSGSTANAMLPTNPTPSTRRGSTIQTASTKATTAKNTTATKPKRSTGGKGASKGEAKAIHSNMGSQNTRASAKRSVVRADGSEEETERDTTAKKRRNPKDSK
jgi:hypothetical protein